METQLKLKSYTTTKAMIPEGLQVHFNGIAFKAFLEITDADLIELLKGDGEFSITIHKKEPKQSIVYKKPIPKTLPH